MNYFDKHSLYPMFYLKQVVKAIRRFAKDNSLHWELSKNNPPAFDFEFDPLDLVIFLRGSWWTRVWTIQELILAKSLVFVCGTESIDGVEMYGMADSFADHTGRRECCDYSNITAHPFLMPGPDLRNRVDEIMKMRAFQMKGEGRGFLDLASIFRRRNVTNPKDKVYGLLGIAKGLHDATVDHSLPVSAVYENATLDLIRNTGNLDVLSHVLPHHLGYSHTPNLASWVPDWGQTTDMNF
jgi:hypothetical protein